ncbi:hypothetical protein B0H19DRAFT_1259196 [Mycena capillaripes]|nr:hypothetical protein B0H19DRAFT_1259196 [Mycena capillaripes]
MAPGSRSRNRTSATSSSRTIQMGATKRSASGRRIKAQATLNAAAMRAAQEEEARVEAERLQAMSRQQRREHDRLRDIPESFDDDYDGGGYEEDVLHGRATASISHAGEGMTQEDVERADDALYERLLQSHRQLYGRYKDTRTRRDRTQK